MPDGYQYISEIWLNFPKHTQIFTRSSRLTTSQHKRPSKFSQSCPSTKPMNKTMPVSRVNRERTSFANDICTLAVWSWWCVSTLLFSGIADFSNSPITLATSGPAIIHRRRALGFSVRPTAPPSGYGKPIRTGEPRLACS